jgi:hypothetical protein
MKHKYFISRADILKRRKNPSLHSTEKNFLDIIISNYENFIGWTDNPVGTCWLDPD